MRYRRIEFLYPPLAVGDLRGKKILVVIIQRFPLQIFIVAIAKCHGRACERIFDTGAQPCLLVFGSLQSSVNCSHNRRNTRAIRLRIALGRTRSESLFLREQILRTGFQKKLEHLTIPVCALGPKDRPAMVKKG